MAEQPNKESLTPSPGPGPWKPLAAPPDPDQQAGDAAGYKPLSVLAVVGFALAALYAAFLLLCIVASLYFGSPLLMGVVVPVVVPLLSLAISALAWLQVQRSEGTRAGGRLAGWGVLLSVLFGLIYGAYYFASTLAIRQQAGPFIVRWFDKLKNGKTDEAFLDTLPPAERPRIDANLAHALELRFNLGPEGSRGRLTQFTQNELIRMVTQSGTEAAVRPLGVSDCLYQEGGYRYRQTFEVKMPEGTFTVQVAAQGTEGKGSQGRQWAILMGETRLASTPEPTPLGVQMGALRRSSAMFVDAWIQKINAGRTDEAYLETLPPARRGPARDAYRGQLALARAAAALAPGCLGPDADPPAARRLYLAGGYRQFLDGSLFQADPNRFWAPSEAARAEMLAEVVKVLERPGDSLHREPINVTLWAREGKQVRILCDTEFRLPPMYALEGAVVAEAEVPEQGPTEETPPGWWVSRIELRRGRTISAPPGAPR